MTKRKLNPVFLHEGEKIRVAHNPPVMDAAALILVDDQNPHRLLLGRRKITLSFMPGLYGFPGGRMEEEDERNHTCKSPFRFNTKASCNL